MPENSRANGGRRCPHLKILVTWVPEKPGLHYRTGETPNKQPRTGLAEGLVNETANTHIHYQTNRQENKQRGGTSVTHER